MEFSCFTVWRCCQVLPADSEEKGETGLLIKLWRGVLSVCVGVAVTTFRSYLSTIIIDGHFSMMAKAINFAAGALLLLGAVRVCYIATIKKDRMWISFCPVM